MLQFVRARPEKQPAYKTLIWAIKANPPSATTSPESFETSARLHYKSETRLARDSFCSDQLQGLIKDTRDLICQSAIARHFAGCGARWAAK
jgi:hypothetical protein